jgi:hypothetical protein
MKGPTASCAVLVMMGCGSAGGEEPIAIGSVEQQMRRSPANGELSASNVQSQPPGVLSSASCPCTELECDALMNEIVEHLTNRDTACNWVEDCMTAARSEPIARDMINASIACNNSPQAMDCIFEGLCAADKTDVWAERCPGIYNGVPPSDC